MAARTLRCPECGRTLGALIDRHDHQGQRYIRLALERNVDTRWRWFRLYAECDCGELVRVPDGARVLQKS